MVVVALLLLVLILLSYVGQSSFTKKHDWFLDWCQMLPEPKLGPRLHWASFRIFFDCGPALLIIGYLYGAWLSDFNIQLERDSRTFARAVIMPHLASCLWNLQLAGFS